jgi:hypothetical protein
MTDKSQKIAKIVIAAGVGIATVYILTKYQKNIFDRILRVKNHLIYDVANVKRTNFQVEVINSPNSENLKRIITSINE